MLKVGVVGLGRGRALLRVFHRRSDVAVVAVCDRDGARAQAVASDFGIGRVFDDYADFLRADLDAVVVASPAPLHAAHTVAALEAGRHVLCEVPAVFSLEECAEVVDAVKRSGRAYMMGENMNYHHYVRQWKARIGQGEIGEVFYAEAEYVHDCRKIMHGPDNWRAQMPPIYYCTHSLGPLLDILDDRCVSAVGMHTGCHTAPDLNAIDMEVGLFRTVKGRVLKVLCGFSVAREPAMHWQVFYGTLGALENRRTPWESAKLFRTGEERLQAIDAEVADPGAPPEAREGGHGTSEFYMVEDFVRAVQTGAPSPIDVYRALDFSAPGLCAHLSATRGGEPVAVRDFREEA